MNPHDESIRQEVLSLLAGGELTVEGRVVDASNLTLYARVDDGSQSLACVYKPVSGERPLWDFPDGTLAGRERASFLVSQAGGWHLVPPTVLRDGPLGPGMCQQWVVTDTRTTWVDVCPADAPVPQGWLTVLHGQDELGRAVALVHRDDPRLRSLALLDAVINNADRKGGHLLSARDGRLLGVDHGVSLHAEPKLRTVLWGWRGEPLTAEDHNRLDSVVSWLDDGADELDSLLTELERARLRDRVEHLGATGRLPGPSGSWPAIPWPAM